MLSFLEEPKMKKENIGILSQYVEALNDACYVLEKKYLMKDIKGLEKTKKFILELKSKISELIKE